MISHDGAPNSGKPKLLVILGAGSSISCGMPSVSDINVQMKDWSREWKSSSDASGSGVFNGLWKIVEKYYDAKPYGICNYERVLGEMTAFAIWLTPGPFGNPLRGAVKDGTPASSFAWPPGEEKDVNFYRKLIIKEQDFLLGKLADYMRKRSISLNTGLSEFVAYQNILLSLRKKFELGIYNLNYDNVARRAWPEAFNGFNERGVFEPLCVSLRREWEFIYHLHGSVHHSINKPTHSPSIVWKDDLRGKFVDQQALALDMAQEFKPISLTTLIAGGFKLDQILADPYQTFYATLVRHVQEADAILIAGYGFGDLHVNRALRNRFERRTNNDAHPQVVLLTEASPDTRMTGIRESREFWAYQLTHTLSTKFRTTNQHLDRKLTVSKLIQKSKFETDVANRVAIWHGGFIEALGSLDMITQRLR